MWITAKTPYVDWNRACGRYVDNSETYPHIFHNAEIIHICPPFNHKLSTGLSTSYPQQQVNENFTHRPSLFPLILRAKQEFDAFIITYSDFGL